ncbi:unnamed protein product [Prorocentrum cordatum]|uniref:ATP synthase F1 complex delta/epsilon subunit N-terminal domain-containing protein n=1 Tax=Prorocentrum cordatum TaxID=2364126 RepID=A0ABN9TCR5_9DINO|nr:unnamed protein product [Polarella glacialis]
MATGTLLRSLADNEWSAQPKIFGLSSHVCGDGKEVFEGLERYSTYANSLWEGAIIMSAALDRNPSLVSGRVVLELGAGLGLPGLVSAALGASRVVLTELEESLPLLQRGLALNRRRLGHATVEVRALDWNWPAEELRGAAGGTVDVVLGCDILAGVVAGCAHYGPVLRAAGSLLRPGGFALFTATPRAGVELSRFTGAFQEALGGTRWRLDLLPESLKAPGFDDGETSLLRLWRPPGPLAEDAVAGVRSWAPGLGCWLPVAEPGSYSLAARRDGCGEPAGWALTLGARPGATVDILDRIKMKLQSPEGAGIDLAVSEVVLPSASGQLGVLANHAPMMTALDTGVIRYKQNGKWMPLVVMGGFASVDSNSLSILVNDFETVDTIDAEAAKKEMEEATAKLEKATSKKEKLDATGDVKKAAARLQDVDGEDDALSKSRWRRAAARGLAVLTATLGMLGLLSCFGFMILESARHMRDHWEVYQKGAERLARDLKVLFLKVPDSILKQTQDISTDMVKTAQDVLYGLLGDFVNNVSSLLLGGLLIPGRLAAHSLAAPRFRLPSGAGGGEAAECRAGGGAADEEAGGSPTRNAHGPATSGRPRTLLYTLFWLCSPVPMNSSIDIMFRKSCNCRECDSASCRGQLTKAFLSIDLASVFAATTFALNYVPEVGPFVAMVLPCPVILFDSRIERPFLVLVTAMGGQLALKFAFSNIIEVKLIESDKKMRCRREAGRQLGDPEGRLVKRVGLHSPGAAGLAVLRELGRACPREEAGIRRLVTRLQWNGVLVRPTDVTIALKSLGTAKLWREAQLLLRSVLASGLQLDSFLLTSASACLPPRQWRHGLATLSSARLESMAPDQQLLATAMASCSRGQQWRRCLGLMGGPGRGELGPSEAGYNIVADH